MRRRVIYACLTAVLVALLAAPAASAATLSVDDDRQDCTAAGYTSIQDAIDAAAPGDTIAICPGTYVEGNGAANSNALTVPKSLTLKGAGADLVTISPRRYDGNDGVIAEDPQSIRYPRGNIITAVGTPAIPVTVDISGVSVDGNGVAAKAGVVFLDAQGSLRRSRVTDIVTSESPNASGLPGGYRSNFLGYGVAQVTSAQMAPAGAGPRTLTIANTRIDEYNRVGLLLDAGTNSASPVTRSGLDLRGVVSASQIVGRTLCWDAHVHGDCGDPTPAGNPQPQPLTTGPLFGQDGIRIVAGARGTVHRVDHHPEPRPGRERARAQQRDEQPEPEHGRRPPVRGRRRGQLDGHPQQHRRQRVRHLQRRAPTGRHSPRGMVSAERNWWGLWSPVGGNPPQPAPLNDGPEVSPTTNPPYPENPVNGTPATATGSSRPSTSSLTAAGRRAIPTRDSSRSCPRRSRSTTGHRR